jgi:hypothetical protein
VITTTTPANAATIAASVGVDGRRPRTIHAINGEPGEAEDAEAGEAAGAVQPQPKRGAVGAKRAPALGRREDREHRERRRHVAQRAQVDRVGPGERVLRDREHRAPRERGEQQHPGGVRRRIAFHADPFGMANARAAMSVAHRSRTAAATAKGQ